MKLFSPDKSELMDVSAIERSGNDLLIKGKVFGHMPMTARLSPEQLRAGSKLMSFKLILFLLTMPFRKSKPKSKTGTKAKSQGA